MDISFHSKIADIPRAEWDALHDGANPFIRHAFLHTLEDRGAAAPDNGWTPHHLAIRQQGRVVAAAPLYRKSNSWGEFVFDWSWAHAYERAGRRYYPKLVVGVPFTPVTGPRLLVGDDGGGDRRGQLVRALGSELERLADSTLHVNFVTDADAAALEGAGLLARQDVQFHWRNRGYRDFEDFLSALSHKRRKNMRRERRRVAEFGVEFDLVTGEHAEPFHWDAMHGFYADTFMRHLNQPVLSRECLEELGRRLGGAVVMVLARRGGKYLAGAFFLRGTDTLYGRYWGCTEDLPDLHFETCYYQGIDFCIEEGLERFEPGAQGEHKLLRGFEPVLTRSFHQVRDPLFRDAIARALDEERRLVAQHRELLAPHAAIKDAQ